MASLTVRPSDSSLCVIIVNDKFNTDVPDRPEAWEDAMRLKDVLQSHGALDPSDDVDSDDSM